MNFFAVDLGATSGRTILGSIQDGKLQQRELTRFPNNIIQTGGHFYWDIFSLYGEIIRSLKHVADEGIGIQSIGIDTWGVDFVCVGKDGGILRNPYSYRDPQTDERARQQLQLAFPRHEIVPIDCRVLIEQHGSLHCCTMQFPQGVLPPPTPSQGGGMSHKNKK